LDIERPDGNGELGRLRHELQQFQEFLEGMPDAVFEIDLQTLRVLAINHMMTVVTGFTHEDVAAGLDARLLARPGESERMAAISSEFIRDGMAKGNGRYVRSETYNALEVELLRRDGTPFDAEIQASYVLDEAGRPRVMRTIVRDISPRKAQQREHEETIRRLEAALGEVRTLRGLIPICAWCHRIRDDKGYWQQLEQFLSEQTEADFTHSICEACAHDFHAQAGHAPHTAAEE